MNKQILKFFSVAAIMLICLSASATKRYWVGNGSNVNWNTTANWSATSGGASGASVPVSTDSVYFNGSGTGQCSINATVSIRRLDVSSGYTDTIKQNSYSITLGTSGMILSGGVFFGGSALISVGGIFTLSGSNFISTTGTLLIGGNYTFSSGTFSHNNGTVRYAGTISVTGSTNFYDMSLVGPASVTFAVSSTFNISHLLSQSAGALVQIIGGTLNVQGDITQSSTYASGGGSGTININGTGTQYFNGHTNHNLTVHGFLPNIKINKSSGTLYLKDLINITGKWEYISGTIDATTYSSIVCFSKGPKNRVIGKQTLNDVYIQTNGGTVDTMEVNSGDTLTIAGTLITSGNGPTAIQGYVDLKGDIIIGNLSTGNGGGDGIININGTGTQTIDGSAGVNIGRLCSIKINKPSGTLYLKDTIPVYGNWNYLQGTVDYTTYNSNVSFNTSATGRTISGNQSFNNVTFYASGGCYINTPANDTLKVNGILLYQGASLVKIESGVVSARGDITINSSFNATNSTGAGTLLINGTGSQIITGDATLGDGRVSSVKISKSAGTLYFKNIFSVQGNWTYVQGTIDATTYNSTIAFVGNEVNNVARTVSGNHTLNNVTIHGSGTTSYNNITSTDTLTILGELLISGTTGIGMNNGTIKQKGDINITNSNDTYVANTGLLYICGTSDQIFSGATASLKAKMCHITINKPSGTLRLKKYISLADNANWKLLNGTLDATTDSSTVVFSRGTRTIQGNQTFYNLHFSSPGAAGINNITSTDSLIVEGELKLVGTSASTLNSGTIKAKGNITITNTNPADGGTALLKICGTANQTLTGSGIAGSGRLPNVTMEKPSGTLTLSSIISLSSHWTYVKGTVDPGSSTIINCGTSNISCGTVMSTAMAFNHFRVYLGTPVLTGVLKLNGGLTIDASRTLNANGKQISIGGNWNNSGTFTYANSTVAFKGTGAQYLIKASGTETFHIFGVNKPSGVLHLTKPISVTSSLVMTSGIVATTATNIINIPDNVTSGVGNDSSYVCGPMKKTGNDAFTFPLGDTTLLKAGYHPLSITAPSVATDAYTAQYFPTNQTYGSTIQTDSLDAISNCEYWLLTRNTGSSTVIPTVGWNTNSCNIYGAYDLAVVGWNGSQWNTLGKSAVTFGTGTGTVSALIGLSLSTLPIAIGNPISKKPTSECVLKKKLDAGYYTVYNGFLKFKFDEEYVNNGSELEFKIYDKNRAVVVSDASTGATLNVVNKDNRWGINVKAINPSLPTGYYVLEVKDRKGEISMLRFKL